MDMVRWRAAWYEDMMTEDTRGATWEPEIYGMEGVRAWIAMGYYAVIEAQISPV